MRSSFVFSFLNIVQYGFAWVHGPNLYSMSNFNGNIEWWSTPDNSTFILMYQTLRSHIMAIIYVNDQFDLKALRLLLAAAVLLCLRSATLEKFKAAQSRLHRKYS